MNDKQNPLSNLSKEEILYQLLKKEHGYYALILELTRQENEKLLKRVPLKEISPLLKQKKVILSCITEIENAMKPLKKFWKEKQDRTDPFSVQIKNQLSTLDSTLKEILQLDLIGQKSLQEHLEFFQEESQKQQNLIK